MTEARLAVSTDVGRTNFRFLAEERPVTAQITLLAVVNDQGVMLWLLAGLVENPNDPVHVARGGTRYGTAPLGEVVYGTVPARFEQLAPASAPPSALTPGQYRVFYSGRESGIARFGVP